MTKSILAQSKKKKKHELGTVIKLNGRTVGQVYKGVFEKNVSAHKHFLHTPEAIAYSLDTLHAAMAAGAEYCEVLDTDTDTKYRASIAKIWDMGRKFNYGFGDQIYLTLQNWTHERGADTTHTDAPEYTEAVTSDIRPLNYKSRAAVGVTVNGVKQLSLFGGDV